MSFWSKLSQASIEVLITFFPLYVVAFVLVLSGHLSDLWSRPDVALLSAVLFAEGWWKMRDANRTSEHERRAMELYGLFGALTGSLIASFQVLNELHLFKDLKTVTLNPNIDMLQLAVFLLAFLYAITVRFILLRK